MSTKRKPKFKVGQVVMIIKRGKWSIPEPAIVMNDNDDAVVVSYGVLGLTLPRATVRPLTKKERGE